MWEHSLVITTDVPARDLWAVVADIPNWPAWCPGVEEVRVSAGGRRLLARERGRWVRLAVKEYHPPFRFVVEGTLFLAHVRTVYEFGPLSGGARAGVSVRLIGPFGRLHAWASGGGLARDLTALVSRLVERARSGVGSRLALSDPSRETTESVLAHPLPVGVESSRSAPPGDRGAAGEAAFVRGAAAPLPGPQQQVFGAR